MSVPAEPLWDIFTPEVIADLQRARSPSERLRTRLAILQAGGLNPSAVNRELRAFKAAWETLCVPKIRFCNIGDEDRRGQAVM
jgi:hypothetical protein